MILIPILFSLCVLCDLCSNNLFTYPDLNHRAHEEHKGEENKNARLLRRAPLTNPRTKKEQQIYVCCSIRKKTIRNQILL